MACWANHQSLSTLLSSHFFLLLVIAIHYLCVAAQVSITANGHALAIHADPPTLVVARRSIHNLYVVTYLFVDISAKVDVKEEVKLEAPKIEKTKESEDAKKEGAKNDDVEMKDDIMFVFLVYIIFI